MKSLRAAVVSTAIVMVAMFVFAVPTVSAQEQPVATCTTFNASSEPTSTFRAGEEILVRGTGFEARSLVLVSFQQDIRTVELTEATTNDLGSFETTDAEIPERVSRGPASIRAVDARGSASCPLTVSSSAGEEDGLEMVYLVWGSALAIFAIVLAVLTYRRWKAQRLREAMDGFNRRDADPERAPSAVAQLAREGHRRVAPSGAEEWTFTERGSARWLDDPDHELWLPERVDLPAEPMARAEEDEDDEPSRLPAGWDGGRPRANRPTSDAIERLRREVRTWNER